MRDHLGYRSHSRTIKSSTKKTGGLRHPPSSEPPAMQKLSLSVFVARKRNCHFPAHEDCLPCRSRTIPRLAELTYSAKVLADYHSFFFFLTSQVILMPSAVAYAGLAEPLSE